MIPRTTTAPKPKTAAAAVPERGVVDKDQLRVELEQRQVQIHHAHERILPQHLREPLVRLPQG